MNTSHNNHRNPIGFKVTDNKLMVIEANNEESEIDPLILHNKAILKMAIEIHNMMEKRAKMFINDQPFFDIEGKKIVPLLNKLYVKWYEKF
jgi:hypothetical protein